MVWETPRDFESHFWARSRVEVHPSSNKVGDFSTLEQTRRRLAQLVYREVERLHGSGQRVFLGGASQGCTVALAP